MPNRYKDLLEWVEAIVIAIVISVVLRLFFFEVIQVEGLSMYPTLREGDRLIVSKIEYTFTQPEVGEIIVFRNTGAERENYIKRIIATAGDEVEIVEGVVFLNGVQLNEPYIIDPSFDNYTKTMIPYNSVFVMGDNRRHSSDSRNPHVGFISLNNVIGTARIRIWPFWNIKWFN